MIYPDIEIKENIVSESEELGKAPFFDIKTGQHIVEKGTIINCCDADAIRQWVYKTIMTALDKYEIYEGTDYGIGVTKYIGQKGYQDGYIASELKRELSEQLTKHSFIKEINDYKTERVRRTLKISFTVKLIDDSNIDVDEFTFNEGAVV